MDRTTPLPFSDSYAVACTYDAMDHTREVDTVMELITQYEPLGKDLLDLGAGTACVAIALCQRYPHIRVMAADRSVEMLELARYRLEMESLTQRIQLQLADSHQLIFQSSYFDTVYCHNLLHQLENPKKALQEMWRVLRPNGLLFLRDWNRPASIDQLERTVQNAYHGEAEEAKNAIRRSMQTAFRLDEVERLLASLEWGSYERQPSSEPLVDSPSPAANATHWQLAIRKGVGVAS